MKRWGPKQAQDHPFITRKPYTGPYTPDMPDPISDTIQDVYDPYDLEDETPTPMGGAGSCPAQVM